MSHIRFCSLTVWFGISILFGALSCTRATKGFEVKEGPVVSLQGQLDARDAAAKTHVPPEKRKIMEAATESLRQSKILEGALKKGAKFPEARLPNHKGQAVNLSDLWASGPVIVTFYRGGWCPYCNLQLRAYQAALPEFRKKGAQLVAISPEEPDQLVLTAQKNEIEFDVLTDRGNRLAKELGLVFGVPEELKKIYLDFGIDLETSQGNPDWELPIPATYVVDSQGVVTYAFLNVNYKERAEPKTILEAL